MAAAAALRELGCALEPRRSLTLGRAGPEAPPLLRPQPPPPTWFQRCAQAGPAGGGAGQGAGRAEQEVRRWRSAA